MGYSEEWEEYLDIIFKIHKEALQDKEYVDLLVAQKRLERFIFQIKEKLYVVEDARTNILNRYGWKDNYKLKDLFLAEIYDNKKKIR